MAGHQDPFAAPRFSSFPELWSVKLKMERGQGGGAAAGPGDWPSYCLFTKHMQKKKKSLAAFTFSQKRGRG